MSVANENIAGDCDEARLDEMEAGVARHMQGVLDVLGIDTEADHNTRGTAARVAKMLVREVFWGRFCPRPRITEFPNTRRLDEIYTLGPIKVRSACSHHFCPILGQLWVGVLPADKILGLSKFVRLADWVMARPQIQEEATVMLADELEALIAPRGLGVLVKARHTCMTWRGVREEAADMVTSVMRGAFLANPAARAEFMAIVAGQGFRA